MQRDVVEALTDQFPLDEMLDFMCRRIELIAPDCMAVAMLGTGASCAPAGTAPFPCPCFRRWKAWRPAPPEGPAARPSSRRKKWWCRIS
ncbi:hypothetical protein [Komagataeibacter kakiaceti]|uniref:hypothetical protein n=1 Tax=Komagataeibacter kakiaceti TaxID=943261 RepID=UPI000A7C45ED|nr:hypothetical protein [Komagataeibacter kakiaceti]